jgi:hypothetical protein
MCDVCLDFLLRIEYPTSHISDLTSVAFDCGIRYASLRSQYFIHILVTSY